MSFITAPIKSDRGRRPVRDNPAYCSWDYLQDTRPSAEQRVFPVGQSDGRASKFKTGFYRRPQEKIDQTREREAYEERKEQGAAQAAQMRYERLNYMNTKNGNVIAPHVIPTTASPSILATSNPTSSTGVAVSAASALPPPPKIFPSRRRFPSRAEEVSLQNHARQKVGASRFHIELTPAEKEARDRNITTRLEAQRQTTSVIGYGRNDLPTDGVVDNFKSGNYSPSDIISKPKLKPPPKEIQTAHATSAINLSDGSTALTAQRLQSSSHTTAPAPVTSGRRANRSNQTSEALQAVFQYNHVDAWRRRDASAVKREASLLPPAGSQAVVPAPIYSSVPMPPLGS